MCVRGCRADYFATAVERSSLTNPTPGRLSTWRNLKVLRRVTGVTEMYQSRPLWPDAGEVCPMTGDGDVEHAPGVFADCRSPKVRAHAQLVLAAVDLPWAHGKLATLAMADGGFKHGLQLVGVKPRCD